MMHIYVMRDKAKQQLSQEYLILMLCNFLYLQFQGSIIYFIKREFINDESNT